MTRYAFCTSVSRAQAAMLLRYDGYLARVQGKPGIINAERWKHDGSIAEDGSIVPQMLILEVIVDLSALRAPRVPREIQAMLDTMEFERCLE